MLKSLKFGQGNAKLDDAVFTFSLPAGWTCPQARDCLSRAHRKTGKITDGRDTEFRCYAATMECRRPSVRAARWHNLDLLRECQSRGAMARLILDSLSPFVGYIRVHDSGDFFNQDYFDAWLDVARARERTLFYAYTKALALWVRRLKDVGDGHTPGRVKNVVLTASWGGKQDGLIGECGLRSARVVYSEDEARSLGLDIDHNDGHAMRHGEDFALLIHGQQPAGSEAAVAVRKLRDGGWSGYSKDRKVRLTLPVLT